jgi:hypothetical protein
MNSFWRTLLASIAVLALGLFLAGCGGGGDDDDDDDTGDGPTAEATDDSGADEGDGGDDTGASSDELKDLAGRFADQEVKISYDFTLSGADSGTFTLYWKPPDAWRMDFSSAGSEGSLITRAGASYLCTEGQCIETPAGSASPLPFFSFITDPDALGSLIDSSVAGVGVDESERKIAGEDARCFSYGSDVAGAGSGEFCFSEDGVMLYFSTEAAGTTTTMEATEVELSVSDADLEPPYPIMEIPGQ